ncbi:Smr/MutS family protein [Devosia sp. MC532]|uniref:Smr/MutS family protein n=1 Tax=Devosia sp. MC532 TaxID=2799788 RepID=UPI0018F407AC|nr:Smr/MutS family protein [Devosia sp. MC532]MBJ7577197.1 Smr/MutS family protein [Devosia sp. MC532]
MKLGGGPLPVPEEFAPPPVPEKKAPPKKLTPGKPFLPPYVPPKPIASVPDKALDPDIHKKVRRGRIEIDGKIDLHGMTQAEAREALYRYIVTRVSYGARTILVITGKGIKTDNDYISAMSERGILRTMLPIWLSEPSMAPLVSGWSMAARGHGGEGAWYVRLRRI